MKGRSRVVMLIVGTIVLVGALVPPLHHMANDLFSAHMVQHLLLLIVAPICLVAGASRRIRIPPIFTTPLAVWVLTAVVMWAWHLPELYDAAVTNPLLHVVEHGSFLLSGGLFWAVVIGSGGYRDRLSRVGLVFATALQSSALGAVIAFASDVLYTSHLNSTRGWGLTPLEDQQLAGAIMWVPPGVIYLIVMLVLLLRAFRSFEAMQQAAGPR